MNVLYPNTSQILPTHLCLVSILRQKNSCIILVQGVLKNQECLKDKRLDSHMAMDNF